MLAAGAAGIAGGSADGTTKRMMSQAVGVAALDVTTGHSLPMVVEVAEVHRPPVLNQLGATDAVNRARQASMPRAKIDRRIAAFSLREAKVRHSGAVTIH